MAVTSLVRDLKKIREDLKAIKNRVLFYACKKDLEGNTSTALDAEYYLRIIDDQLDIAELKLTNLRDKKLVKEFLP